MTKTYEIKREGGIRYVVQDVKTRHPVDLRERTFEFAVAVIELLRSLLKATEHDVVRFQLAKAATSVGSNYEESQAAVSKADFRHRIGICLKEARESNYWLRIMYRTEMGDPVEVSRLARESEELKLIFASIYNKVSDNR